MFAHLVQREQAFVFDRLGDHAFAYTVATAHFIGVFHRHRARVPLMTHVTNIRFAKHQLIAKLVDVFAFAQQLEIPRTVDRVPVQAGTHQLVILDHQALVNAAHRIRQRDVFGPLATLKIACAEQINARHLELGRSHRSNVATNAIFSQMIRAHFRHFKQRRN